MRVTDLPKIVVAGRFMLEPEGQHFSGHRLPAGCIIYKCPIISRNNIDPAVMPETCANIGSRALTFKNEAREGKACCCEQPG